MRTILFIGGGLEATHGIERAREMGLKTVVSDQNPDAPGCRMADAVLQASTYDVAGTVGAVDAYVSRHGAIDGVIAISADVPRTIAAIADRLNVKGLSLESGELCADKLAMKQRLQVDGVPVPWFSAVENVEHLKELMAAEGPNLVLKPVDSRGGRGVMRLNSNLDLGLAFYLSKAQSPSDRVMVERYLSGPQISTESLIQNGVCHTVGFSDRNYEFLDLYAPYFIENGGDLPSRLPDRAQAALRDVAAAAARSLGIDHGTIKGDLVWSDGQPYVIEMAGRMSGGFFCTREIPLNTGVDFVGLAIKLALGDPVAEDDFRSRFSHPVIQRYKFVEPGIVQSIDGIDEIRSWDGIEDVVLYVEPGDEIGSIDNSTSRAAMILATGPSKTAARDLARRAIDRLTIRTEAEWHMPLSESA